MNTAGDFPIYEKEELEALDEFMDFVKKESEEELQSVLSNMQEQEQEFQPQRGRKEARVAFRSQGQLRPLVGNKCTRDRKNSLRQAVPKQHLLALRKIVLTLQKLVLAELLLVLRRKVVGLNKCSGRIREEQQEGLQEDHLVTIT